MKDGTGATFPPPMGANPANTGTDSAAPPSAFRRSAGPAATAERKRCRSPALSPVIPPPAPATARIVAAFGRAEHAPWTPRPGLAPARVPGYPMGPGKGAWDGAGRD